MKHPVSAFVLVLASVGMAQEAEGAGAGSPVGQIACNRGGAILLLDAATGKETVLVEDNTYDRPLYWLPGGDRLVYWNHDGGAWDLWAIEPESGRTGNLTGTARDNRSPCASPDGRVIAFHRGGEGVWLMDPDGGNQRQIHRLGHRDDAPVWSPSGRRLAFDDLEQAGEGRVRVMLHLVDLETDAVAATKALGRGEVAFFLDERQLVISANHEGANELVVLDVTTGERRALTRSEAGDSRAVLSPDRQRIAWIEHGEPNDRLKIMKVDGSGPRELAAIDHWYAPPSFSPDGRFVTFESGKERRKTEVCVVATDGGPVLPLTEKGGSFPVWRPTRSRR